jgi:hypothetical protein
MFSALRGFEICCDAPPYGVVRACEKCGLDTPLDVRWCRRSDFVRGAGHWRAGFCSRLWQWFCGNGNSAVSICSCGQPLPKAETYSFSFLHRKVGDYLLGQCARCRTVFWDQAPAPVPAEERVIELLGPMHG